MSIINSILDNFGTTTFLESKDNFDVFECTHEIKLSEKTKDNTAEKEAYKTLEKLKNNKIEPSITFSSDCTDAIQISINTESNFLATTSNLREQESYLEEESFKVTIRIDKSGRDTLEIFDYQKFCSYLASTTLEESLKNWSGFDNSKPVSINIWEENQGFTTSTFSVNSVYPSDNKKNQAEGIEKSKRHALIEKRDKCSHFANASSLNFIPEDFQVDNTNSNDVLIKHFQGITNALFIIYISDFTSIDKNIIKYRLKGYKLLSDSIDFEDIKNHPSTEFDEIYKWTYFEGNYTDKIGLSRNIISIHLKHDSILSIENGTSNSIKSGYDLYLKDNVKQYIEIKNKISEFIQTQSDKAL